MMTSNPQTQNQVPASVSIWKHGAIGAALAALLVEVDILFIAYKVYIHNTTFILLNLFLGTPLNFVLYWPFFTLIAWIWRKLGNLSWMPKILAIALFLAGIVIVLRLLVGEEAVIYQFPPVEGL